MPAPAVDVVGDADADADVDDVEPEAEPDDEGEDVAAGTVIVVVTWRTFLTPHPAVASAATAAATIQSTIERRGIASW